MTNNEKILVVKARDWSQLNELSFDEDINCSKSINNIELDNMGIYLDDKRKYHTSGFVGICRLKNKSGKYIVDKEGNNLVLQVMPRFEVDPWEMLICVMQDTEFESYIVNNQYRFFEIFYEENPIKLDISSFGGEMLLALSFIKCCNKLCKGTIIKKMSKAEENLVGTIRGQININEQLKKNVMHGREDRIYCSYPVFSEDTIENRILKKALLKAKSIVLCQGKEIKADLFDVRAMIRYSEKVLVNVKDVIVTKSDFANASLTGFNSRYKPAVQLASTLLNNCTVSIDESGEKTGYVLPYAIKMETLFEFYIRSKIKKYLETNKIKNVRIDQYRNINNKSELLYTTKNETVYLQKNYIPDIAIQMLDEDIKDWKYVAVFDAKYQYSQSMVNFESKRHNSHQLLFYMLLLNVNRCGFVFPKEKSKEKVFFKEKLNIQNGNAITCARFYTEIDISKNKEEQQKAFERLLSYSME